MDQEKLKKKRILFVCLGNICRSPSAEAVFTGLVNRKGLFSRFEIDSAGTGSWHVGEPADKRMQSHAVKRGFTLTSISRMFDPDVDFDRFDMIIAMDDYNYRTLKYMAGSEEELRKLYKMTDFRKEWNYDEIPDPYYGGEEGFELVLDLLEDSCNGLLEKLTDK